MSKSPESKPERWNTPEEALAALQRGVDKALAENAALEAEERHKPLATAETRRTLQDRS